MMMAGKIEMMHMILRVAEGNVEEAERYAKKAHALKTSQKAVADWCVDMAKHHLEFNEKGCRMLDQICREMEAYSGDMVAAIKAMVKEKRAHLAEETVEVKIMLEMYDR